MHGPTCIFWANLTPFSLLRGRWDARGVEEGNAGAVVLAVGGGVIRARPRIFPSRLFTEHIRGYVICIRLAQRCKLTDAFLWEYSYERLKLAQLLGQHGVFLTGVRESDLTAGGCSQG
jgi:hypothetical protein